MKSLLFTDDRHDTSCLLSNVDISCPLQILQEKNRHVIIPPLMNITTHCSPMNHHHTSLFSFFPDSFSLHDVPLLYKKEDKTCVLVDLEQLSKVLEDKKHNLPELLLSEEEQMFFSRFNYPKRRREWLGGRLAAKTAMLLFSHTHEALPAAFAELTILPNKYGRPVASTSPEIAISISHSCRFATAMAVKAPACGIDLQKISPKLPGLTSRFTSEEEKNQLSTLYPDIQLTTLLTMIWTAKEAVKKSLLHDQPTVFSGITIQQSARRLQNSFLLSCTIRNNPARQEVEVNNYPPYVLAMTQG